LLTGSAAVPSTLQAAAVGGSFSADRNAENLGKGWGFKKIWGNFFMNIVFQVQIRNGID